MRVTELPPAEIARMREKAVAVSDKYTKELAPELVRALPAELDKARAGR